METTTPATPTTDAPVVLSPVEKPYDGPCQVTARTHAKGQGKFIAAVTSPAEAELVKAELATDPDYAGATIVVSPFTPEPIMSAKDWVAKRAQQRRISALKAELKALK